MINTKVLPCLRHIDSNKYCIWYIKGKLHTYKKWGGAHAYNGYLHVACKNEQIKKKKKNETHVTYEKKLKLR